MSLIEHILFFFDIFQKFFQQMNSVDEEPDDVEPIS
jgi:hypothetical protein